jgi:hypothetical protein
VARLERRFRSDGVLFRDADGNLRFPLPTASPAQPQLALLEQLWVEERLAESDDGYLLPLDAVYDLEPGPARLLDLPVADTEARIELRSSSYVGRPDFSVAALLTLPEWGLVAPGARTGPFVEADGRWIRLPKPQLRLLQLLAERVPSAVDEQWVYLGEVKRAAEAAGAELDRFIAEQEVFVSEGVTAELDVTETGQLLLGPAFDGVPEGGFESAKKREASTRSVYFDAEGLRRRRLVIPKDQRQNADELKRRPAISGPDVPRFLENPEAFLPDGVDLSEFSARVRGLIPTRYNSRPYIHVTPTRDRDWFEVSFQVDVAEVDAPGAITGNGAAAPREAPHGNGAARPDRSPDPADALAGLPPDDFAELCRRVVETGERWQHLDGAWVDIDPEHAAGFLNAWDARQESAGGKILVQRGFVLDVISNLDQLEFTISEIGAPAGVELPEYELPSRFAGTLLPHQAYGYRWLRYLHERRLGGLLADDMGLGKTVQIIACMARLSEMNQLRPALVVMPVALVENWLRELRRFAPSIRRVYVHQGPQRHRDAALLESYDIVFTTYQTLRRDQLMLGRIDWTMIVCDEAQNVKNPTAQMTAATKGMKARVRVAATGTPVENGLSELWCIVDFAQPGKLGSQREFRQTFEQPLISAADPAETARLVGELQDRLVPHYVRRLKRDVLEGLPERSDVRYDVGLGPRQRQIYARLAGAVRDGSMIPLEGIQKLITVCSHPELTEPAGAHIDDLIEECPKLQQALALLAPVKEAGERAVIFTRLRSMQRILQDALRHRYGVHAPIINGEVAGARRVDMVEQFNGADSFGVLILGPEAGGVGLNIIGANHVVHYTRLWNPAKENQATDRVHRLGQIRPVTVHYPIVAGTVEEKLDQLLEEKRSLAENVLVPRESLSVMDELIESLGARVA